MTSLRRRDQREKGLQYVQGLLATPGRKSIRNIAQQIGGAATDQSLHHFIAGSTWDWRPIRTALSQYLEQSCPLTAWVVQPMAIPKGGEHSVGVGRQYDPQRAQMFRGQQAFGIWFTSADVVTPVGWRLHLPEEEGDGFGETYEECAVTGILEAARQVGLPPRPVLLDIQNIGTRSTMNRFADARLPVLARVSPDARLLVTDPALPGHGAGAVTASEVLQKVRTLRTPVKWADPIHPGRPRTTLVAAVRVMMPDPAPARRPASDPAGRMDRRTPRALAAVAHRPHPARAAHPGRAATADEAHGPGVGDLGPQRAGGGAAGLRGAFTVRVAPARDDGFGGARGALPVGNRGVGRAGPRLSTGRAPNCGFPLCGSPVRAALCEIDPRPGSRACGPLRT